MKRTRIVIIGGGIAGLATAWFLARRGCREVVLLEREEQLGTHSTGRNAAILRTLIPDDVTRAIAREGARFLHQPPEGFAEHPLIDPCGLVLAVDGHDETACDPWMGLGNGEVEIRRISADAVRSLVPHYGRETCGGLHVPGEGGIDVAELVRGFAAGARAGGVSIQTGAAVEELLLEGAAVRGVRLAGGEVLRAETTVIAAGGWAGLLGRRAGSSLALRPTRRHLLVTAPNPAVDPAWPIIWTLSNAFYARPESGGLMMSACDQVDVDPDRCKADPEVRERIAAAALRFVPDFADEGVAHFWCGMRTLTADDRFAIGPDGDVPGLFWVAGLGGHGIVCAAGVGRLASELLLDGQSALAETVAPARFARVTP